MELTNFVYPDVECADFKHASFIFDYKKYAKQNIVDLWRFKELDGKSITVIKVGKSVVAGLAIYRIDLVKNKREAKIQQILYDKDHL